MKRMAAAVLVAAVGLAACGSSVEQDANYASIEDFRHAVESSGVSCSEWNPGSNDGGRVTGICDGVAFLAVDTTGAALDPAKVVVAALFTGLNAERDPVMLHAENWLLSASPNIARKAQKSLGGAEFAWDELTGDELLDGYK